MEESHPKFKINWTVQVVNSAYSGNWEWEARGTFKDHGYSGVSHKSFETIEEALQDAKEVLERYTKYYRECYLIKKGALKTTYHWTL